MSGRQSEEVLLQVPHVRHKKSDGTLYLMAERFGWMMMSKDTFHLHYNYVDIKTQKISPEGKAKIQLQMVFHDGNSVTFHFSNPQGQETQIRDRDSVKEMLQQLLPRFRKKVDKEFEEKNRLLSKNPGLLQLYKDLVITQIQTAEEFWSQHTPKSQSNQLTRQDVGVSGSFLSDIKPQADGANGLRYNLTPDIRESIFKTYPEVKKKHLENVPYNMTEQDFWTKFFQSHYFHRDRILSSQVGVKDIFTECGKADDKSIREQLKAGVTDKTANIGGFSDRALDENYGISTEDGGSAPQSSSGKGGSSKKAISVHQNIIKRFNQHSIMILKTSDTGLDVTPESTHQLNGKNNQNPQKTSSSRSEDIPNNDPKLKRLRDKLNYEDLEAPPEKKMAPLKLAKVERYLNGPTPASQSEYLTFEGISKARQALRKELSQWGTRKQNVISANSAVSALVDLSPGGALMQSNAQVADQCPEKVRQDVALLYASLAELSRHFWACFPPTTPTLQEKATKMYDTLKKFQQLKIIPFENELKRNYTSMNVKLTAHLSQMLEAAFKKYATWKQKKLPGAKR